MPVTLQWSEIALRLILSVIAGAMIGWNRSEHGRPAGLRTTLLVCMAASISMIQTNLLMDTVGRTSDSFIMLDLMRLPLGILTGVGFIGAGAILRRESRVVGLTTAATLWFVTVMGLCFGGGQKLLGVTALAIGMAVLWGLRWIEMQIPQDRQATLCLTIGAGGLTDDEIRQTIRLAGFQIVSLGLTRDKVEQHRELRCELRWRAHSDDTQEPSLLDELSRLPGVSRLKWCPEGALPGLG
jgi:putative Mg2+ transporter-C (MgtC) family protein